MIALLATLLCTVLAAIAALHVYWALGGRWGFEAALPQDANGQLVIYPGAMSCLVVAVGSGGMAWFYGSMILPPVWNPLPSAWQPYVGWVIVAIFAIRGIGDVRYCGVTRQLKTTDFARRDRLYFTPLCWIIAALALGLQLLAFRPFL